MEARIDHVSVLIPARDEEALLPDCLRSVLSACCALPQSVQYNIVVAVDSSTDQTFALAKKTLRYLGKVLVLNAGAAGAARAAAAIAALEGYRGELRHLWFANTDADCRVPENWLTQQLMFAKRGVEAVAGIVDVDDFSEHRPGVEKAFRESYRMHPDGTHPHVHGANVGFRADAYVRAGGWYGQATGEDHDLWRRIGASGASHLSCSALKVLTSGRRNGRAIQGFADALAAHDQADQAVA